MSFSIQITSEEELSPCIKLSDYHPHSQINSSIHMPLKNRKFKKKRARFCCFRGQATATKGAEEAAAFVQSSKPIPCCATLPIVVISVATRFEGNDFQTGDWVYGLHLACFVSHCLALSEYILSVPKEAASVHYKTKTHELQSWKGLGLTPPLPVKCWDCSPTWALSSSAACSTSGCCRASSLTSGAQDAFELPNIKQNRPFSVRRCVFSIYPGKETKEQFSVLGQAVQGSSIVYLLINIDIGSSLWNRQSSLKELQIQELIVACQPVEAPFVPISHWVLEENNEFLLFVRNLFCECCH